MKKVLLAGVAGCALFIVNSASADVNVLANIDKTKTISVTERITITKQVDFTALVNVTPGKAAESDGIVNQANYDNKACGNCAEKLDQIINSIGGGEAGANHGIVNVNQSSGNMNNQGNAVSVAWDAVIVPPPAPPGGNPPPGVPPRGNSAFANSQAHVDQKNGAYNETDPQTGAFTGIGYSANVVDAVDLLFRDTEITNSVNNNTGIVDVNQSVGNMNNQGNNVSVAVALTGINGGVALSEADLGQLNTGNSVQESNSTPNDDAIAMLGIHKSASIDGSINDNVGIINVSQGSGNMANQANNVSAAFVVVPAAIQ